MAERFSDLQFTKLSSRRSFEEVVAQIRAKIGNGELKEGDRLPAERDLAVRLGVSRNTVREAFRSLENAGLLHLKKGVTGGAFISGGNTDTVTTALHDLFSLGALKAPDLFEARLILARETARLACARRTDTDLADLAENIVRTKEAVARGDFIARMEINLEFNRLLARATHNPVLAVLTDALVGITRDFVHAVGVMPNRFALLSRERLLEHLRQRDGEAAAREVGDYLQRAQRYQFGQVGGVRGSGKPRAPAPAKPEPVAPVAKAPRAAPATRGRNTAPQAVPAKKTQRS